MEIIGNILEGALHIIIILGILFWFFGIPLITAMMSMFGGGGEYNDSNHYQHPGYHYVDDYYRSDGTHVEGHWRTNPDEYKWNNLSE